MNDDARSQNIQINSFKKKSAKNKNTHFHHPIKRNVSRDLRTSNRASGKKIKM